MDSSRFDSFRIHVQPAMVSKLEEFHLLGYDSVAEEALWEYLVRKKWKKVKEDKKLYEIIQDILAVKVSDYISYATIESYKTAGLSLDDETDWKELLK